MLEKITNISAGSDYKNATSKTGRYNRTSQFINALNSSMTDSISLSPAVSYLNSLNWKLKKINKVKENLIVIFSSIASPPAYYRRKGKKLKLICANHFLI